MIDIDRRDFLKTAAAAATAAAAGSAVSAFAAEEAGLPLPPGIIYTEAQQGRWQGKAGSHAPKIQIEAGKVSIFTVHPMTAQHFIVRHTLVLADGTVVGDKTFTSDDKPESSYELPKDYKGKIYAASFCNLHDLWVRETVV
jgi:superoxide reductase